MRSLLVVGAALFAAVTFFGMSVARADCSVPGYANSADPRLAGYPPCDEVETFNIQTPRGPRQVSIIRDRHMPADWHEPNGLVRQGIIRSAETLRAIGRGTVPNLVVLITGLQPREELPDPDDREAVAADERTFHEGVANGRSGDECLIVVFPGNTGRAALGFTVAHEFFHCVQYALVHDQMTVDGGFSVNRWWVEGTAEWFANLAYPDSNASARYIPRFDDRTPYEPFFVANYDAFIYWSWYSREWGDAQVLRYLPLTPVSSDAAAQKHAAAEMIVPERWLEFVQAYLDRELRYPDGRRIAVDPEPGETHLWTDTAEQDLAAETLLFHRATLIFTCGKWTIETQGEEGEWEVRDPEEPGAWTKLPEELDVEPGKEKRFLLGAVGLTEAGFRLTIRATREQESEEACLCGRFVEQARAEGGGAGRDSCLVGTWQLTSGGLNEWLNRAVSQAQRDSGTWASYDSDTEAEEEGRRLIIGEDGRYHYGASSIGWSQEATTEKGDRYASRIRSVGGGAGFWTTKDGMLNVCAASESSGATAELQFKDEHMTVELPNFLSEHLYSGAYYYECSGATLSLRHTEVPRTPFPMEWSYRRVE